MPPAYGKHTNRPADPEADEIAQLEHVHQARSSVAPFAKLRPSTASCAMRLSVMMCFRPLQVHLHETPKVVSESSWTLIGGGGT
jgi:hypothetical protein